MKKVLLIRLDRMGDLVLTLPCDSALKKKNYETHWFTPRGLEFVVEQSEGAIDHQSFSKTFSWQHFIEMIKAIGQIGPDASISFHVPWWVNLALFLARVPTRGGVLSQWHSYLFLNRGLRQKRSQCEHHEMEYNFLLTEHVLKEQGLEREPLKLTRPNRADLNINTDQNYYVVHPGMGGSALNWPPNRYCELINQLSEKAPVMITGTAGDRPYLEPLKHQLKDNNQVVWLDGRLDGYALLTLLSQAQAVVAPSTGVLHLSASLGVPSLGLYSPIGVHHPKRWGPKGPATQVFLPEVTCPAQFECLKEACPNYDCMSKVESRPVLDAILSQ